MLLFEAHQKRCTRATAAAIAFVGVLLFVVPLAISNHYLLGGAIIMLVPTCVRPSLGLSRAACSVQRAACGVWRIACSVYE